jgi:murein DD-endopeptidase MepM/ murein hydrolase activator NlpD
MGHVKYSKEQVFRTRVVIDTTRQGERIGAVGTTGNAKGKSPHLHYSIMTLVPYPWRIDNGKQGWKKMFYLNPINYLR